MSLPAKREAARYARERHKISERKACGLLKLWRSTKRYKKQRVQDQDLRERMRTLSERWRRFGYRRIHTMLKREGIKVNHKKLLRIYREEKLLIRQRKRKKLVSLARVPIAAPSGTNQRWSMDFVSDRIATTGRRIRCLNIVDDYSRECLAIEVGTSLPGERVVEVLDRLIFLRGKPKSIVIDNGPEFTGRAMDTWAYSQEVKLDFIRPGKPVENAFIESFNGKFRDECLNDEWFVSLDHAKDLIEKWREEYNKLRPHSSLGGLTPEEFARRPA